MKEKSEITKNRQYKTFFGTFFFLVIVFLILLTIFGDKNYYSNYSTNQKNIWYLPKIIECKMNDFYNMFYLIFLIIIMFVILFVFIQK